MLAVVLIRLQVEEALMIESSGKNCSNKTEIGKTALVLGGTGLVGGYCLEQLLRHPSYTKVIALVRRPLKLQLQTSTNEKDNKNLNENEHENLNEFIQIVADLNDLEKLEQYPPIDDVFCCLGTTIKKAGSQRAFRKVDFDMPLNLAKYFHASACKNSNTDSLLTDDSDVKTHDVKKQAPLKFFGLISSVGADATSSVFYSKTKGEIEQALINLPLKTFTEYLTIIRPSIILGPRTEKRLGEDLGKFFMQIFSFAFIGRLQRYKPVHASNIAATLIAEANCILQECMVHSGPRNVSIIESEEITRSDPIH